VAKLNKNIISFLQLRYCRCPASLIDKTLAAAAVHRVIGHLDLAIEEKPERLSPTALGIPLERFIRHSGIADHE
jgi:hypothetical protein